MGEVRPPHEINKAALRGRNLTGPLGWMRGGASGHRLGGVTINARSIRSGSTGLEWHKCQ